MFQLSTAISYEHSLSATTTAAAAASYEHSLASSEAANIAILEKLEMWLRQTWLSNKYRIEESYRRGWSVSQVPPCQGRTNVVKVALVGANAAACCAAMFSRTGPNQDNWLSSLLMYNRSGGVLDVRCISRMRLVRDERLSQ